MTGTRIYPKADATTQWHEDDFSRGTFTKVDKFLLHSTETLGWPTYALSDGSQPGAKAPTITYHPRLRKFRQHNFINTSARALVDPTSTPVRENRDNVVQIEIIGYADEVKADSVGGLKISQLTDDQLRDIADLFAWLNAEWGCPLVSNYEFPPYRPYKDVRLTSAEYDAAVGLLGHCHASGNDHTDPGNINNAKILAFAKKGNIMATLDADDLKNIAEAVWAKIPWGSSGGVPSSSAANNLGWQSFWTQNIYNAMNTLSPTIAAIEGAVNALAADNDAVDLESFKAAAKEAFEAALKSSLAVTVTPVEPTA